MAEATNAQMQAYCDQRIRPFAEQARALYLAAKDHKAAIDDVYARSAGSNVWNDARTDAPHLLAAGGSSSPNDPLTFNSFISAFISFIEGNGDWATFQRACVRPVSA